MFEGGGEERAEGWFFCKLQRGRGSSNIRLIIKA